MNDKKIEPAYLPESALEHLICAGDVAGVLQHLEGAGTAERQGHRKSLRQIGRPLLKARYVSDPATSAWRGRASRQQERAFHTAKFICGSTEEQIDSCWDFMHQEDDLLVLWRRFPPADPSAFVDAMISKSAANFRYAQALFVGGLSARPEHDNYLLGLLALPMESDRVMSVRSCIERDPALIQDVLLRLFDIEGTSDNCLAGHDKYGSGLNSPRHGWSGLFLELCEQGAYSRALLLEKTLGALERDWIQFRAGWFSRFHEALAPTPGEMAPFSERYLGLCQSRIAPTVTLALAALGRLFDGSAVSAASLVAALRPVLSSSVKAQVETGLKLLDQVVARDRGLSAAACEIAMAAFGHPVADVHKKVIVRLRAWTLNDATRQMAREVLAHVSAANRGDLAVLIGDEAPLSGVKPTAPTAGRLPVQNLLSAIDQSRALSPICDIGELVERAAYSLENGSDIDELERVLDALLRSVPFSPDDQKRFDPVMKRARTLRNTDKPIERALIRLFLFLFDAIERTPVASYALGHFKASAFLGERIDDLMALACQGKHVSPLAAATHKRGVIAPLVLIERVKRHLESGVISSMHEQVLSLLRLHPGPDEAALTAARALPETPYTLALRYALGDTVGFDTATPLIAAAARIRHPNRDDLQLIAHVGDLGPDGAHAARHTFSVTVDEYGLHHGRIDASPPPRLVDPHYIAIMRHPSTPRNEWEDRMYNRFSEQDEGLILLAATILPSCLESFFAEAVRSLVDNLKSSAADWHNKAYLTLLLDPTVTLTPMAYRAMVCGLAVKEPGQKAMAVDALVGSWTEGRLDISMMAIVMREMMETPLLKAARIAKSLSAAALAHEQAPRMVFDLLCEAILFEAPSPPKDTAALLELMLAVALEANTSMPEATRSAVALMRIGGKGKAAQKELLARC